MNRATRSEDQAIEAESGEDTQVKSKAEEVQSRGGGGHGERFFGLLLSGSEGLGKNVVGAVWVGGTFRVAIRRRHEDDCASQ